MRARFAVALLLAPFALAVLPGGAQAQAVSEPSVRSTMPARFQAGDSVRVSFRYQVPDSVGRARIRVLLLNGGEVVGALREVRPSVAQGSGVAEALEVFDVPVVADAVRVVLSGPRGFLQDAESPLAVATPVGMGDLRRPGWLDPGVGQGEEEPIEGQLAVEEESIAPGEVVALVVDPGVPLAVLPAVPRDTVTVQEAIRFSPVALRRLTTQIVQPKDRLPADVQRLRPGQTEALAEVLRGASVPDRPEVPPTPPMEILPQAQDTSGAPGPWTIQPDGSMERSYPDGTVEIIDAAGNRMTCAPEPGSDELRCIMPLFAQIPRVIPSSELATVDVAWLESMDAWLEQLAADALAEMRILVADEASIEAYLGLEDGQNLYQRLDQRLDFLSRLIN